MTTSIIAPTTATVPAIDPLIGTWQIRLDGEVYGPTWTFKDVAASHVQACRKFFPGCWELVCAKSGQRVAVDAMEEAFLASQEQFESREAAEEGAPVETPAPCGYCGEVVGSLDTLDDFRFLAVNDPACLGCLQGMAQSHAHGQYAGFC